MRRERYCNYCQTESESGNVSGCGKGEETTPTTTCLSVFVCGCPGGAGTY